jgi:hypothetical protein
LCQGTTLQAAEKIALATVSYQGMTSVMPQSVQNRRLALAAVGLSTLRQDFFSSLFSRADQALDFDPRGL